MDWFWGIAALVGSVGGIGVLIYLQARGGLDRVGEDSARDFFDRHGHWPDETAQEHAERVAAADGAARSSSIAAQAGSAGIDVEDAPPPPPTRLERLVRALPRRRRGRTA